MEPRLICNPARISAGLLHHMLQGARGIAFVTAALLTTLAVSRPAHAGDYTVSDLGTVGGKLNSWVWQQSVNSSGLVAAYANDIDDPNAFFGDVAFLWRKGKTTELPGLPGAVSTLALSLNDVGQVVGSSQPDGDLYHAVLWDKNVILTLGEPPGDSGSYAFAINNRGQAVGTSFDASGSVFQAVLWDGDQIVVLPPAPGGGGAEEALSINERGQIVGISGPAFGLEHAVLWDGDTVTDLGLLGGNWANPLAINNRSQVVGGAETASGVIHAFSWENGTISDLGVLGDDVYGLALDINNRGQIVGFSGESLIDITTAHALLWVDGAMIELQTRIPVDSGWTLLAAAGINERGMISGYGIHDGEFRAFLLTPAGEVMR